MNASTYTPLIFASVLLISALVVLAIGVSFSGTAPTILERLRGKSRKNSAFYTIFGILAPINYPILRILRVRKYIAKKLEIVRWTVTPEEFASAKEMLAILLPLILYIFDVTKPLYLVVAGVVGFIIPDFSLNSAVKQRKYSIVRMLPETVDLLSLCVGAGLDFMAAVRWVLEKAKPNPMIEELGRVLEEINLGKARSQALRDMSRRLEISDLSSFTRTLIQADRMGTPVEEAFNIISEDMRMRRFQRGQRQAFKSPIKILIPLIFCILPIILIIVGGPILIQFVKYGGIGNIQPTP